MNFSRSLRLAAIGLALLALVAGCGKRKGQISGTVKYKGKNVVVGTVTVYDEEERPFQSMIDQGRYYVSGIPEGPIKIIVISEDPNKSNLPPGAPKRAGSKPR